MYESLIANHEFDATLEAGCTPLHESLLAQRCGVRDAASSRWANLLGLQRRPE
jgi:hypothetical protein